MNYRVRLTPVTDYIFFGESVYESKKRYFEKESMEIPQVSTIFGMLKEEILKMRKLYNEDFNYNKEMLKKIEEEVGGFHIDKLEDNNHGMIKSVSPLYFAEKSDLGEIFYQRSYVNTSDANSIDFGYSKVEQNKVISSFENLNLGADPKKWIDSYLVSLDENCTFKKTSDVIKSKKSSHVSLGYDGHKKINPGKDSFFVEQSYYLEKGFSFVFDFQFNCDEELISENEYVRIGSKSNVFKFEIEKIEDNQTYDELIHKSKNYLNITEAIGKESTNAKYVTENTIIDPSINAIILGQTNSFRFFNKYTVTNSNNTASGTLTKGKEFSEPNSENRKNILYKMVMPGSLIIFKNANNIELSKLDYGLTLYNTKGEKNE